MGLRRKEGIHGKEHQQFDIRGTVDNFKREIGMYGFWKPGMDIFVSHVRRRELPAFVFPGGYKRSRPSRHSNKQTGQSGKLLKKKREHEKDEMMPDETAKRASISPRRSSLFSPESNASDTGGETESSYLVNKDSVNDLGARSRGGNVESEKGTTIAYIESGESINCEAVPLNDQSSVDEQTMPIVSNVVESSRLQQAVTVSELHASYEVHDGQTAEICNVELNEIRSGALGSTLRQPLEAESTWTVLNREDGATPGGQELVKPCNQEAAAGMMDGLLESKSGTKNLSCEVSFSA